MNQVITIIVHNINGKEYYITLPNEAEIQMYKVEGEDGNLYGFTIECTSDYPIDAEIRNIGESIKN